MPTDPRARSRPGHLVGRFIGSLSNREPIGSELEAARAILFREEFLLWMSMQGRDKRHSLLVLRRFDALAPGAMRAERAAALLHDVGKTQSDLGVVGRVCATILGPVTRRFSAYRDHEELGARMLEGVSESRTLDLVRGRCQDAIAVALRTADDI